MHRLSLQNVNIQLKYGYSISLIEPSNWVANSSENTVVLSWTPWYAE